MAKPRSQKPAGSDRRPTVLVVDDDRVLRGLLSDALEAHGWHVVQSSNGLSALQVLDEYRVDALVSDLHLGNGPSGEKLIEAARRNSPRCKICLLSGWITRSARERAQAVGAAIFEKPVEIDELIEELERGHRETTP